MRVQPPSLILLIMSYPDEYNPEQPSGMKWLFENQEVVQADTRLQELIERSNWSREDEDYVRSVEERFRVFDMDSFYRVQGHRWLLFHPDAMAHNGFLQRAFTNLQNGYPLPARDLETLNRTVWRFMSEDDRKAAGGARREAERCFGGPVRRRHVPRTPPSVAGYPFEVAEAYLNYHRADADMFAAHYYPPRHNREPPPRSYQ